VVSCVATSCGVSVASYLDSAVSCVAVPCHVLQCRVICCNILSCQCRVIPCSLLLCDKGGLSLNQPPRLDSVLQYVAMRCSVLQRGAVSLNQGGDVSE